MHRTLECVGECMRPYATSVCGLTLRVYHILTRECVGVSRIFGDDALLSLVFFEVTRQVYSAASASDKNISQVHMALLKIIHS